MLRRLIPGLLLAVCAGCASGPSESSPAELAQAEQTQDLRLAGSPEPGRMGLFGDQGIVRVGDTWEKARQVFPEPTRGANGLFELPQSIPSKFEAHGWEAKGQGFGVISLEGKVVLAMYQLEHIKQDTVQEKVKAQQDNLGNAQTVVSGRTVTYWFWNDPQAEQTLMVCALATLSDYNVTIAMGDDNVLARLGISVKDAVKDAQRIDNSPPKLLPSGQR